MMRSIIGILLLGVLAGCGSGPDLSTRALDNACSIAQEKPKYMRAMERTQKRWGVPVAVQMATIYQESKFDRDARTPYRFTLGIIPMGRQSSAYGYAQALDGTWDEYRVEAGRFGARRNRINDATDFIGWYMDKTEERNGISKGDAKNQYLAYHEGHTGYARGSYKRKGWLVRVSDEVAARANMYQSQLVACGKT